MGTEKRPSGIMLYFEEIRPIISLLSETERGQLFTAILDYGEYGTNPILCDRLVPVWPFIQRRIDHDTETYRKKCEKASKAAKTRWENGAEKADI